MLFPGVVDLRFPILWLLITADISFGLRAVSVTVPTVVKRGDNALLICNYDLEGDVLYSVKWYKGRREFYRYTPKENPAMKSFPYTGIKVVLEQSNVTHLYLSAVELTASGKYKCEVSSDAPAFHTTIVSGEMEVVQMPKHKPIITGIHTRYRQGDTLHGNCMSNLSKPAANLTWTINDQMATSSSITSYNPIKDENNTYLETSVLELHFTVTNDHFDNHSGRLKLRCTSKIHDMYLQHIDKYIEEDRPKILASGSSGHMNLYQPFDQSSPDDEVFDQNGIYLTRSKELPFH